LAGWMIVAAHVPRCGCLMDVGVKYDHWNSRGMRALEYRDHLRGTRRRYRQSAYSLGDLIFEDRYLLINIQLALGRHHRQPNPGMSLGRILRAGFDPLPPFAVEPLGHQRD